MDAGTGMDRAFSILPYLPYLFTRFRVCTPARARVHSFAAFALIN